MKPVEILLLYVCFILLIVLLYLYFVLVSKGLWTGENRKVFVCVGYRSVSLGVTV